MKKIILIIFFFVSVCYAEDESSKRIFCPKINYNCWQCEPFGDGRFFFLTDKSVITVADDKVVFLPKMETFPFYDLYITVKLAVKDRGQLIVFINTNSGRFISYEKK